ncbi:hypothetical protein [Burkholderia sola]|uniref:hypothetical protein n=1 Tax=Burkholderia sola TaxID=2843302 RepID=UPI0023DD7584|nr:hypothetical protein [Burkholderia sola]MDF3083725.1 hypothetical protein [Burkholderia sola]
MIPENAHSPFSRIIHSTPFAVRRFFVNDRKIFETAPRRPASRAVSAHSPAFSSGHQCKYVIFSDMPHCVFIPEFFSIITNRN